MLDEIIISRLRDKKVDNTSGVYVILNIITNKVYIGSSTNLKRRKNDHFCMLKKNAHTNIILQNSWNKYGEKSFIFLTIEKCDIINVRCLEQEYLDKYKPFNGNGYNISTKVDGFNNDYNKERDTYCKNGHRFNLENVYFHSVTGKKECRLCKNIASAKYNTKRKSLKEAAPKIAKLKCKKGLHYLTEKCLLEKECSQCKKIARNRYSEKRSKARKDARSIKELTCRVGHVRTQENTYVSPSGKKRCLVCEKMSRHKRESLRAKG